MLRPEIMVTVTFLLNSNTIGLHQKYKKTLLLKSLNLPHSVMHFKTGDDMMNSSYSVARKKKLLEITKCFAQLCTSEECKIGDQVGK